MKKKILIMVSSLILIFSTSFAGSDSKTIPAKVSAVFSRDFSNAGNVRWEAAGEYYKASFDKRGMTLYAFYTGDGEFMGIASYLLSDRLPGSLQSEIHKKYAGYWITDLFQFNINNAPGYFITLENADHKIMLKAEENKSWSFYSEVKKG